MDILDFTKKYKTNDEVVLLPIDKEVPVELTLTPYPDKPTLDFEPLPYKAMEHVRKLMFEAEEQLIKKVLFAYLKREPTIEDAKRCTRIEHIGFPGRYGIAYGHVQLGMVRQGMDGFTFQGCEIIFSSE